MKNDTKKQLLIILFLLMTPILLAQVNLEIQASRTTGTLILAIPILTEVGKSPKEWLQGMYLSYLAPMK